jgi:hypothetical protein
VPTHSEAKNGRVREGAGADRHDEKERATNSPTQQQKRPTNSPTQQEAEDGGDSAPVVMDKRCVFSMDRTCSL